MGFVFLVQLLVLLSVCRGSMPPEPTRPAVDMVYNSAAEATEFPLLTHLPSVIDFMDEHLPLFVEWFTIRPVYFAFPAFLRNYTLHITSSDLEVGTMGNDGWSELSTTTPMNVSDEGMFFNLTQLNKFGYMYDAFSTLPIMPVDDSSLALPTRGDKGRKQDPKEGTKTRREVEEPQSDSSEDDEQQAELNRRLMGRLRRLTQEDVAPLVANFTVIGHRFGKTTLSFKLYRQVDGAMVLDPEMTALAKNVDILNMRIPTTFDMAFGTIMLVLGALVTGIMGCQLEWTPLKKILRRPFGIIIGFCSQFIIMPLTAFLMCVFFDLPHDHAIGIILAACSPGGGLSNMTSVAIDAYLLLSIAMTFFSVIIALGMMPLNLFIYSRRFVSEDSFPIPFGKIAIGLISMVVPLAAGCLLRYFKKPWALKLIRYLKPISLAVIAFALAGGIYTIRFVFTYIVPSMIVCSFIIPFIAFFMGGMAAFLCRRSIKEVKTIAIETAIQNVGIGAGIVRLVYPSPDADIITCAILWTLLGQSCLIFAVIGSYMFYKKILKDRFGIGRKKLENVEEVDDVEDKRPSGDQTEVVPLNEDGEDRKPTDVANGTVHPHLSRMNKFPAPSAGMTMGNYRFWGYRPLMNTAIGGGSDQAQQDVPGLFVTFPSGMPGVKATQLWAPPIIGPSGDIWIPNEELFKNSPESTV